MTHQVTLPPEIDRLLAAKSFETGQDVASLIQTAVTQFLQREQVAPQNEHGDWTAETDARRCNLIDQDMSGTITTAERSELAALDQRANDDFDRIVPPPVGGESAERTAGGPTEKPWMAFAGILAGEPGDSASTNAPADGRQRPS
jgi:hypothetical protein